MFQVAHCNVLIGDTVSHGRKKNKAQTLWVLEKLKGMLFFLLLVKHNSTTLPTMYEGNHEKYIQLENEENSAVKVSLVVSCYYTSNLKHSDARFEATLNNNVCFNKLNWSEMWRVTIFNTAIL